MRKFLNKIKFSLNLDPRIEKRNDYQKFIPGDKKCVLIIYADFELAWAWRYSKFFENSLEIAKIKGLKERNNIPAILDVCDEYLIPVTWAAVGHLFLESCKRENGKAHSNLIRHPYFENQNWKYDKGDWFDCDPCSDYESAPEWYSPDLIESIIDSKAGHEIGCHTFSHIDCTDKNCNPELFDNDISECIKAADKFGLNLKSFVHPAHTIGNLDGLIRHGFKSYRTDYANILGYPEKYKNKLWQFKSTWEFVCFNEWSIDYHVNRYREIINRACRYNTVCVLWFHPSMDIKFFELIMPDVFDYINSRRDEIFITTAGGYADFLENVGS